MKIPIYQVDAFTDEKFHGNPAAVCILQEWISDGSMQKIAAENNLAETAFVVEKNRNFELRWFTPAVEVDLCGHATLATAYVFKEHLGYQPEEIAFKTKSGILKVIFGGNIMSMIFPSRPGIVVEAPQELLEGIKIKPSEVLKSVEDFMVVLRSEDEVSELRPDLDLLKKLDCRGTIVTSRGNEVDFVSRFFAPQAGIPEDPVTGSSHTTLIPYWSRKLNKKSMTALQISQRRGKLFCEDLGDKVKIAGKALTYMIGEINL
ncbi:MAG TPA: PhzF family phenazine biosynthesis protein [Candidatus Acidoferrales bacterium]|nr:PhzF family phenazine biosynthesis protein [Candidatus Acidoferrales bacterium]